MSAVPYMAHLELLGGEGGGESSDRRSTTLSVPFLSLTEAYSSGWRVEARIFTRTNTGLTLGTMLSSVHASGFSPGKATVLHLALATTDNTRGGIIRSWPSVVSRLTPFRPGNELLGTGCELELVDPMTYLSDRPIWGAYRSCPVGAMVGGALSLAAGGNGKPTLTPMLDGLPAVRIVENYREALKELPYSIASGQTLGEWLDDVLGHLNLRSEVLGRADGSVEVTLSDKLPAGDQIEMVVAGSDSAQTGAGRLAVTGLSTQTGGIVRGGVLDVPSQGRFRHLGASNAVGALFSGPEIGLDEAARRMNNAMNGAYVEMFQVRSMSRQPNFRPGRRVKLNMTILNRDMWQVTHVSHVLNGGKYDNAANLLVSDKPWHPPLPPPKPSTLVTGVVDGGADVEAHEPVERDRLGRILVTFPFLPAPDDDLVSEALGDTGGSAPESRADTGNGQSAAIGRSEQWPPRIPLTIIGPIAGGMHGFISAHRQGDVCRVAVHNPLWAEIIGFQYRQDRRINTQIVGATAGMVVEHDHGNAWTGMVFRPAEDLGGEDDDE